MIALTVNGRRGEVDAEADTPLLWVLRDYLDMTGTKFGCGMALCGACTVHIDGQPTRSCGTPASAVAGKGITTIEAIGATQAGNAGKDDCVGEYGPHCANRPPTPVPTPTHALSLHLNPSPTHT